MVNAEMKIVKFDCGDVLTTSGGGAMTCGLADGAPAGFTISPSSYRIGRNIISESFYFGIINDFTDATNLDDETPVYDGNWTLVGTLSQVYNMGTYYHALGDNGVQICYDQGHNWMLGASDNNTSDGSGSGNGVLDLLG